LLLWGSFDAAWYYFLLFAPLVLPLLRRHRVQFFALMYRTAFLHEATRPRDRLKLMTHRLLQRSLGRRYRLIVNREAFADPTRGVVMLHGLLDESQALPTRTEARRRLGIDDDRPLVLFFGNVNDPRKRFDRVLAAIDCLPGNWRVLVKLPADGPHRGAILDRPDRFRWLEGDVDQSRRVAMYRATDVVLLPYDQTFDQPSGCLTDAVLYETPIATTRFPFAVEVMARHRIGVFLDEREISGWGEALSGLSADGFRDTLRRCKATWLDEFDRQVASIFGDATR
jgi:glycosyltransferase involved in cell wall biosynthesis